MDNTDLKTEAPFVKMSVNVILTGAISKASGGDFYQGAMRALVVYLYNDLADYIKRQSLGRQFVSDLLVDRLRLNAVQGKKPIPSGPNLPKHPLAAVAGVFQIISGEGLCDTVIGCLIGGPLMAHGFNNIEESYTDEDGYLMQGYKSFFGEKLGGYAYGIIDVELSLGAAALDLSKIVSCSRNSMGLVEPIYKFETKSGIAAGFFELVSDSNTISSTLGGDSW